MPHLALTDTWQWLVLAGEWAQQHSEDPVSLSLDERRASQAARAAYYLAVRDPSPPEAGIPPPVGCDLCGDPTYSWCEGCYLRCEGCTPYSGLCTLCDSEQRVCYACSGLEITYSAGHRAYLDQEKKEEEAPEEIQILGTSSSGSTFQLQPTERRSLGEVAAASGRSSEEILGDLTRALSSAATRRPWTSLSRLAGR